MKIGLDLRLLQSSDHYSTFIALLLQKLISTDGEDTYTLYMSANTNAQFPSSINVELIKEEPGTFAEQLYFSRKLSKDKNNLMIFFNEEKPLRYKGDYIVFVKDLKEIHYEGEKSGVKKFFEGLFLNTSLDNAKKIICFENHTKNELNEKLNIPENKLEIVYPFFTPQKLEKTKTIGNIKTKYSIKGDYFIYSGGGGNNKNLSKLVEVFKKLHERKQKISLVILEQEITEDINFRNEVVDAGIVENVFFIGDTTPEEKKAFYESATGTLFPSLYESFPFSLTEAITYNSPLLVSSINQIQEIMGNSVAYFSPVSTIDMIEAIENFVSMGKKDTNYNQLLLKYNADSSAKQLLKVIKEL
ncbi:glycosyltransferase [Candidatus Gracilibacteria bacterium]|nr:glycosyltransferase [Candidatus Gracilibacteria bacterium]